MNVKINFALSILAFSLLLISCDKEPPPPPPDPPVAGTNYFRAQAGGTDQNFILGLSGSISFVAPFNELRIEGNDSTTGASFILRIQNKSSFTEGIYLCYPPANQNVLKNCKPVYAPSQGAAAFSNAQQSQPGTFSAKITLINATRISGTFSGVLYKDNGNNLNESVNITDGAFSIAR